MNISGPSRRPPRSPDQTFPIQYPLRLKSVARLVTLRGGELATVVSLTPIYLTLSVSQLDVPMSILKSLGVKHVDY